MNAANDESTAQASGTGAPAQRRSLLVMRGDEVEAFALPLAGELSVGRAAECDIRIDHKSVSRDHLRLSLSDASIRVTDRGGSNGTSLRGVRLPVDVPVEISANEAITVGDVVLVIQEVRTSLPGATATAREPRPSGRVEAPRRVVLADPEMQQLFALAARVARGTIGVLLVGETGAGKEVLAEHVHRTSPRSSGPLIRVNCAALTDTLVESELFGHAKGAFTGADKDRRGHIEAANGGTVFLDEVGEVSPAVQAKLLRVLEDGLVTRVGESTPRTVDVRFVAATNRDLEAEVAAGRFRRDLYFRIAGAVLAIPPLRERPLEIELLAESFAGGRRLTGAAMAALRAHAWPGNVRELRNVIERAELLVDDPGAPIDVEHLGLGAAPAVPPPPNGTSLPDELASLERQRILTALDECGGNQTRAAERLGIPLRTLVKRLDAYAIPRPRKK